MGLHIGVVAEGSVASSDGSHGPEFLQETEGIVDRGPTDHRKIGRYRVENLGGGGMAGVPIQKLQDRPALGGERTAAALELLGKFGLGVGRTHSYSLECLGPNVKRGNKQGRRNHVRAGRRYGCR